MKKVKSAINISVTSIPNADYPDQPDAKCKMQITGKKHPEAGEILSSIIDTMLENPTIAEQIEETWGDTDRFLVYIALTRLAQSHGDTALAFLTETAVTLHHELLGLAEDQEDAEDEDDEE